MRKSAVMLFAITTLFSSATFALPAQVFIIRHGEKPPVGPNLTQQGMERAQALVPYFMYTKQLIQFGMPVAIFAEGPAHGDQPTRAMETCAPLAKALNIPLISQYTKDEYTPMAQNILQNPQYNGKTVLVCWEHKRIPAVAFALGVRPIPQTWPDNVFDRTWVITYSDGKVSNFQDLPQQLLYGDETQ